MNTTKDANTELNLWQHTIAALWLYAIMITPIVILWAVGRAYLEVQPTLQQYPAYDLTVTVVAVLLAIVVVGDMIRHKHNKRGSEE